MRTKKTTVFGFCVARLMRAAKLKKEFETKPTIDTWSFNEGRHLNARTKEINYHENEVKERKKKKKTDSMLLCVFELQ